MSDDFFIKTKCDRCGGSLDRGRIMSMYNEECICLKCKEEETKRPDYKEAIEKDIKKYKDSLKFNCCICQREFSGYGNSPNPVILEGRCCDECNAKVVIPARLNIRRVLKEFADKLDDK